MSLKKKLVWLPYDMDTAIGINNEGELVFDYQLEDIDHQQNGENIFNGQDSVIWKNIRTAFPDKLKEMYRNLRSSGALSYQRVEEMFENHQNVWSESIFNEDARFKYIDPFIFNNQDYLGMLLGSKAEQRKWWLYNRFRYIDSKYIAGDAMTDTITLRPYAADDISITPYADIYATIAWDANITQERCPRNTTVTLKCPYDSMNDNVVTIYSASQLASIGDVSGLQVGVINVSNATRIQNIKVGDSNPNYDNTNLRSLTLGNNILLQTLDVRNCSGLGNTSLQGHTQQTVDISGCSIIENVYFSGTNITGITFPNGGVLKNISLPETITNLTILNQPSIQTFSMDGGDYSNISTLRIENCSSAIPVLSILSEMSANSRVRIIGFTLAVSSIQDVEDFYDYLDTMRGLDENGNNLDNAVVSGIITGLDSITGAWMAEMRARYPDIQIEYNHITSNLYYYNYDGSVLLDTEIIYDGGNGTKTNNITRQADAHYTYTPNGWSKVANGSPDANALANVVADRIVYAAYDAEGQKYRVRFYNGSTLLKTVNNVLYGGTAEPPTETPVYSADPENFSFTGWSPSNVNIEGNTDCYAQYRDNRSVVVKYLAGTLEEYNSDSNTKLATQAFYGLSNLTSITAPATVVESTISPSGSKLKTVDLTSSEPVAIAESAFADNASLETVFIRSASVSTLSSKSAFSNTAISAGVGAIYVPSSLISDYKSASNWSTYADQIYPIDAYPVTDFSTISDSWEYIVKADANKYSVGSTKKLNVNGKDIYMQIVAKNTDVLADDSGTANYTWMAKGFYDTYHMNPSPNTSENGWLASDMRKWLRETVLPTIDSTVVSNMKEVTKTYYDETTSSTLSTTDTVFIPSMREMFGGSGHENSGITYTDYFKTDSQRIKYNMFSNSAYNWWLRSAYSVTNFRYVTNNGTGTNAYGAASAIGVVLCFCT